MADPARTVLPAANSAALVATLFVNWLANALPINGQTPAEIANRFDVYYIPAGYVFGIWSIIYLGLIAFAVWQWLPAHRGSPLIRRIGWLFVVSCIGNAGWIVVWHYELWLASIPLMLTMLLSLLAIYLRLDIGREPVATSERWCVHFPIQLYLGWICVATLSNVSVVLSGLSTSST